MIHSFVEQNRNFPAVMMFSYGTEKRAVHIVARAADNRETPKQNRIAFNASPASSTQNYYDGTTDRPVYCRVSTQPLLPLNSTIK